MKLQITREKLSLLGISVALAILSGCASVPMATKAQDSAAKTFAPPPPDTSGIYIFRNSFIGQGLVKAISIDGRRIGGSANKVYFYKLISPGSHTLSTESEFSDNSISFEAQAGKNYFARQYIKMGAFAGGANLEMVSEEEGKNEVLGCDLAQSSSSLMLGSKPKSTPANTAPQAKPAVQSSLPPENTSPQAQKAVPARQMNKEGHLEYEAENAAKKAGCQTADGSRPAAEPVEIGGGLEVYEFQCTQQRMTVRCDISCQVAR
ncbi:MAG: DUF2846 domain-containing protein [Azonexaceae bacterium]|nr:DUF2846 domain-containing protein [Azonexaceae bacterium]